MKRITFIIFSILVGSSANAQKLNKINFVSDCVDVGDVFSGQSLLIWHPFQTVSGNVVFSSFKGNGQCLPKNSITDRVYSSLEKDSVQVLYYKVPATNNYNDTSFLMSFTLTGNFQDSSKTIAITGRIIRSKRLADSILYLNQLDSLSKKNGYWSELKSENDSTILRGLYINGKKEGIWEWLYPSGNLKRVSNHIRNRNDGEYFRYYDNGKIKQHGFWRAKGNKNYGRLMQFDKNGVCKSMEDFDDKGNIVSTTYFFENSSTIFHTETFYFKDKKRFQHSIRFDKNGAIVFDYEAEIKEPKFP